MLIQHIERDLSRAKDYGLPIVFTIGTTSKIEPEGYGTPLRLTNDFVLFGCVLFTERQLLEVIPLVDGECDYIFVDAEKKVPIKSALGDLPQYAKTIASFETGNFSRICFNLVKKSRVFEYKPNDRSSLLGLHFSGGPWLHQL